MTTVLDDFDSRPGSATSILRTVVGTSLRALGERIRPAALVSLMGAAGIAPGPARTAITRVKAKGLLLDDVASGRSILRLNPAAHPMLARGDRRIFTPAMMRPEDGWCLIAVSVPEERREARAQLRRRLAWMGCGHVQSALWVCPAHLAHEVFDVLDELQVRAGATLFHATGLLSGALPEAVAAWWDLDAIATLHERFLDAHGAELAALGPETPPREAFAARVRAIDTWRAVPYLDPGLPAELLPADWPGAQSIPLYEHMLAVTAAGAEAFLAETVAAEGVRA